MRAKDRTNKKVKIGQWQFILDEKASKIICKDLRKVKNIVACGTKAREWEAPIQKSARTFLEIFSILSQIWVMPIMFFFQNYILFSTLLNILHCSSSLSSYLSYSFGYLDWKMINVYFLKQSLGYNNLIES